MKTKITFRNEPELEAAFREDSRLYRVYENEIKSGVLPADHPYVLARRTYLDLLVLWRSDRPV